VFVTRRDATDTDLAGYPADPNPDIRYPVRPNTGWISAEIQPDFLLKI
jgi:hypothetical protein